MASMRPPEFTGGNMCLTGLTLPGRSHASMRPPEFTGGNSSRVGSGMASSTWRFNEAAGIHRRKLLPASTALALDP